jgi:3-dehydroquinate dehydratase-2
MRHLLLLNGPNLNLLGQREPHIYGSTTLADIERTLGQQAETAGFVLDCLQSNAEHELIERLHACLGSRMEGVVINPGGLTHSSVALRDALLATSLPYVEVHISNIHAREPFRHHSYLSDRALGVVCGLGPYGYEAGLSALIHHLQNQ